MLNKKRQDKYIDASVGEKFKNTGGHTQLPVGVFVGYHTVSKLESIKVINDLYAEVKVDFTGDFGHETGGLNVTLNKDGLIQAIDAFWIKLLY